MNLAECFAMPNNQFVWFPLADAAYQSDINKFAKLENLIYFELTLDKVMPRHIFKFIYLILVTTAVGTLCYWNNLMQPTKLADASVDRLSCVSYSPFHQPGQTPFNRDLVISPTQIESDLQQLSQQFTCVRTYSVDQGLDAVPKLAQKLGLQVWLGVWIGRDTGNNNHEIEIATRLAQQFPDTIRGLIVGNEVLLRREQTPTRLRDILLDVKNRVPFLPVSYADSWDFWLRYHHELADAVSFATVHILPFWDDDTVAAKDAAQYVADTYHKVQTEMSGKALMIGETGWPSYGRQRQDAAASLLNQALFIREFSAIAQAEAIPYNIIEAFDQPWKRHSEGAVGGYWGMFDDNAQPKFALHGQVAEAPNWCQLAFLTMLTLFVLFSYLHWRRQKLDHSIALVILPLSIIGGGASVAYWRDMLMTNRNLLEWSYSVFYALALLLVTYGFVLNLIHCLAQQRYDCKQPPLQLKLLIANQCYCDDWLILLRRLFLFAAAVVCLLLVFDLRNRDYPLALFSLPAIGWFLMACIQRQTDISLEETICAVWVGLAGLWLPVIEHMIFRPDMSFHFADGINPNAFYWSVICLLLSGSVLWRQSTQNPDA